MDCVVCNPGQMCIALWADGQVRRYGIRRVRDQRRRRPTPALRHRGIADTTVFQPGRVQDTQAIEGQRGMRAGDGQGLRRQPLAGQTIGPTQVAEGFQAGLLRDGVGGGDLTADRADEAAVDGVVRGGHIAEAGQGYSS